MTKRVSLTVTPKNPEDFQRIKTNLLKKGFVNESISDGLSFFYRDKSMVAVVRIKKGTQKTNDQQATFTINKIQEVSNENAVRA